MLTHKSHDTMRTISGQVFDVLSPEAKNINLYDIAHALSMTCRYGGHVQKFYSVAEHSVIVSHLCTPKDALWGLMHDAAEAYVGDVIRPVKRYLGEFVNIEEKFMMEICKKFGMKPGMPGSVRKADMNAYFFEEYYLRGVNHWSGGKIPKWASGMSLEPANQKLAKQMFLDRFYELYEPETICGAV